jgi:hypothetical protein
MWQPTLAPGSLRSDSLRLLSPRVFKGAETGLAVRDPQVVSLAGRNGPQARRGAARRPAEPGVSLRLSAWARETEPRQT